MFFKSVKIYFSNTKLCFMFSFHRQQWINFICTSPKPFIILCFKLSLVMWNYVQEIQIQNSKSCSIKISVQYVVTYYCSHVSIFKFTFYFPQHLLFEDATNIEKCCQFFFFFSLPYYSCPQKETGSFSHTDCKS